MIRVFFAIMNRMDNIEMLVAAAEDLLATLGDGDRHTVATAARTQEGVVLSALNISHYSGAICAEIGVLVKLISEDKAPELLVTIGDQNRGIVAPCGRCRQVLTDYFPGTKVIMPSRKISTLQELLPEAYTWFKK